MKKLFCLLMTLCMMAAVPALAAEDLTGRTHSAAANA